MSVRFSFQGPRQWKRASVCVGVANLTRAVVSVNTFLSHPVVFVSDRFAQRAAQCLPLGGADPRDAFSARSVETDDRRPFVLTSLLDRRGRSEQRSRACCFRRGVRSRSHTGSECRFGQDRFAIFFSKLGHFETAMDGFAGPFSGGEPHGLSTCGGAVERSWFLPWFPNLDGRDTMGRARFSTGFPLRLRAGDLAGADFARGWATWAFLSRSRRPGGVAENSQMARRVKKKTKVRVRFCHTL
jgi:hypothetical protein